jgi:1,4-dihydroxy-2-naphthoyl-CoA hydrolase
MRNMTIEEINEFCKNTLVEHLDIEFVEVTPTTVVARMPVHAPTHQPMGYLHGGASLALAETVGSAGSLFLIDPNKFNVFGMQVSANHISSIREGFVIAKATLLHKGRTSHVWDVEIKDEDDKLISVARVTNAIVERKG